MQKMTISFEITVFDNYEALSEEASFLMGLAVAARQNAYAPYSNFYVGAAVLLQNGETVIGNNQENASYPSGLCAERVAVFQAGAKYPGIAIKAIAIAAASAKHGVAKPVAPCGNCRQSILEYEVRQKSPITLFMMGESGPVAKCDGLVHLLPLSFDSSFLG